MNEERERIRQAISAQYGALARRAAGEGDTIVLEAASAAACCDDGCCATESVTAAACCGDGCCAPADLSEDEKQFVKGLYAEGEVAGLPEGAIDAAAGCGNPVAIAELAEGESVLDLGAGGGIDCFLAARQVGPAGRVIGVDMTPAMVELARRNARELGVTNVEFRLGEIEALPVADAAVDVVISNCVVNLSTDKAATLREAYRALKPGGRLRISDMVWRESRPELPGSPQEWAACVSGAATVAEMVGALAESGFVHPRADSLREVSGYTGLVSALISAEKPSR